MQRETKYQEFNRSRIGRNGTSAVDQTFFATQGYPVPTTTIYQDNKSTILLAENGRSSSSKRTRHINVRYFFVTDKIKKGEVKVAFCPTTNMLRDFFTKPLQGSTFKKCKASF